MGQKPRVQQAKEAFADSQALPQELLGLGVVEDHLAPGVGQDHPLGQVGDEGGEDGPFPLHEGLGLLDPGLHLLLQSGFLLGQALHQAA